MFQEPILLLTGIHHTFESRSQILGKWKTTNYQHMAAKGFVSNQASWLQTYHFSVSELLICYVLCEVPKAIEHIFIVIFNIVVIFFIIILIIGFVLKAETASKHYEIGEYPFVFSRENNISFTVFYETWTVQNYMCYTFAFPSAYDSVVCCICL